jgi:hypothetical protein
VNSPPPSTPTSVVKGYLDNNFRCVFWPAIGDTKGPREEGWPKKTYTLADYHEGYRVGLITGVEIAPGRFIHDVDLDWEPGSGIAQALLPNTGFVFGRQSKKVSHCLYTLPIALPSFRYEDVDKTVLTELRGTKANGEVGLQTMAPPSMWSKDGKREALAFVAANAPSHIEVAAYLKHRIALAAIAQILAKNLGKNGFGHDARLCVAGFLLRLNVAAEDIIAIGKAISPYCNNIEVSDVERSVTSTVSSLGVDQRKVKGGPALAKLIGPKGKAVLARISEWLGKDADFTRNANGGIIARSKENITRAIEQLGRELSFDEFAGQMLIDGKPLEDPQWKALYLDIETEFKFSPPLEYFRIVMEDACTKNSFHPVRQYLEPLVWDQVPRIDTWLITSAGAIDTPLTRAISSIMLIAAVRRVKHPGCKFDEMVVWESPQGMNKSTAVQALCPNVKWFSDDLRLNIHSKELIEATLGKWIIEASDLAGKRKAEIDQLKSVMSRQIDGPARMAYAHMPVTRPRQFIWIGTTNNSEYLNDTTGGRRFWPLVVNRFDIAWIVQHRDQLWAEACAREAKGESIRLPEELWGDAAVEQEKRQTVDPWEPILHKLLVATPPRGDGKVRIATSQLWEAIGVMMERRDSFGSKRLAAIMQRFGYKGTHVRPAPGEGPEVGYIGEPLEERRDEDEYGSDLPPADDIPF